MSEIQITELEAQRLEGMRLELIEELRVGTVDLSDLSTWWAARL